LDFDDLLRRCIKGDALAWEALVRRLQGRVYAVARFYLRDGEEARDIAQEALIRVYRSLNTFRMGTNFTAWVLRITRNCAIDRLRQLRASPSTEELPEDDLVADAACILAQPAEVGESHQLLYRAMELMTPAHREMILLKDIQGLEQKEIAEMLSLPLGTVKTRASRARIELARRILDIDPTYGALP
jgi:RNA polymerase sigma-70 factor (ECF subfamily)